MENKFSGINLGDEAGDRNLNPVKVDEQFVELPERIKEQELKVLKLSEDVIDFKKTSRNSGSKYTI